MKLLRLSLLALLLSTSIASSQSVQQTGNVTNGHVAKWVANGIIGDGGAVTANDALSGGSTTSITSGTTNYCATSGCATSAAIASAVPFTGTAANLNVAVAVAPGAGQNIVATLMVGPYGALVATASTCTISTVATSCADATHQVNIPAGQAWAVRLVTSAGAASTGGETFGLQFISATPPQPTSPYVLQSGSITSQHLTWWITNGVVGDAGIAVPSTHGSLLATLSSPPAFVAGDAACFLNTAGVLQDCGRPNGNVQGPLSSTNGFIPTWSGTSGGVLQAGIDPAGIDQNTLRSVVANDTVLITDCGKTLQLGTGSTGQFTETLPSVSGFPATCKVTVTNGDTARGKILSGFPANVVSKLYPLQTVVVEIVNGAWAAPQIPGLWPINNGIVVYIDRVSGNDANDCLATGAGACATSTQAMSDIAQNMVNNSLITIQYSSTTYNNLPFVARSYQGGGTILVQGVLANCGTGTFTCAVTLSCTAACGSSGNVGLMVFDGALSNFSLNSGVNGKWIIAGFKLTSSFAGNTGIVIAGNNMSFQYTNIEFGSFTTGSGESHISCIYASHIDQTGPLLISGGADQHASIFDGCTYHERGPTVTIQNTPAFIYFVNAQAAGIIGIAAGIYSGSVNASTTKCRSFGNGIIDTAGTFASLPGGIACTAGQGGQVF